MPQQGLVKVGEVTHYFTDLGVGVVELSGKLQVGDKIAIKGATTDLNQEVASMQIEEEDVEEAGPGQSIGLKVNKRVREGDTVFRTD